MMVMRKTKLIVEDRLSLLKPLPGYRCERDEEGDALFEWNSKKLHDEVDEKVHCLHYM